jgi:hypothetical protein
MGTTIPTALFFRTAVYVWGGLLVWGADFALTYVLAALACAGALPGVTPGAFSMPLLAAGLGALALVATLALLRRALGRLRTREPADAPGRFADSLAVGSAALGTLAVVWTGWTPLVAGGACGINS